VYISISLSTYVVGEVVFDANTNALICFPDHKPGYGTGFGFFDVTDRHTYDIGTPSELLFHPFGEAF